MIPIPFILAAIVLGFAFARAKRNDTPTLPEGNDGDGGTPPPAPPYDDGGAIPPPNYTASKPEREAARQWIWQWGVYWENELVMPGLAAFLQAVAWGESRFNPYARNTTEKGSNPNHARGIFQIRPKSAFKQKDFGDLATSNPDALFDLRVSMAAILRYLQSLRNYAPKSEIDFLALRRGMGYPSHTKDFAEAKERSPKVRGRLEKALNALQLPRKLMYRKVFVHGYRPRSMVSMLGEMGLSKQQLKNLNPQKGDGLP